LEELGEEVITDLAKATYVALGELGAYDRSI
jgi:hypothetical protein